MECDMCSKNGTGHDDFVCASCARSLVYLTRLETAQALLERERLNQQVTAIVDSRPGPGNTDPITQQAQQRWDEEVRSADASMARERTEEMQKHVTTLRNDVEEIKAEVTQRKKNLATRKSALEVIDKTVPNRRRASIGTLSEVKDKGTSSLGTVASRSASIRAFLCREAATLLRLRQRKRSKNGMFVEQYTITGLVLPDLKEINNVRCADLTASLTSTAHLLVLVAFYLGVRLPAEITTPHRDYPLPTINTPAQSYLGHKKTAFPGSGSLSTATAPNSGSSSPFSSKHHQQDDHASGRAKYRPRPLFIGSDERDEKVAQFAKRDPVAFAFFVEGISLLAWNTAWLCRTQGFSQGTNSWEEICEIGRNLHQLTVAQPQPPAILRVLSTRDAQQNQNQRLSHVRSPLRRPSSGTSTPSHDGNTHTANTQSPFARLGQASHLSTQAFLSQATFNDNLRTWKFSKYNTVVDGLKKLLVTEMKNAEWELLDQQEWDDGGEQFDEAVLINNRVNDRRVSDDIRSVMTMKATIEEHEQQQQQGNQSAGEGGKGGKPKEKKGWTKLKSRSEN